MKKAILIILAVAFICTVYSAKQKLVVDKNNQEKIEVYFEERFSVDQWIENLMGLAEGRTIQELTACWTEDSFMRKVKLPTWQHVWTLEPRGDGTYYVWDRGELPVGYERNGKLTTRYQYSFIDVYDPHGNIVGNMPIVWYAEEEVFYEDYGVEDEQGIKVFFAELAGFFQRLGRTIVIFVEIVINVFKNLGSLLPWNATVPI